MKVMLRRNQAGGLVAYIPKKDLEEAVVAMEPDADGRHRLLTLANGWRLVADLGPGEISLPATVEARRVIS